MIFCFVFLFYLAISTLQIYESICLPYLSVPIPHYQNQKTMQDNLKSRVKEHKDADLNSKGKGWEMGDGNENGKIE